MAEVHEIRTFSTVCACVCWGGGELNMDIKLWVEHVGSWGRIDGGREKVFRELHPSTLYL